MYSKSGIVPLGTMLYNQRLWVDNNSCKKAVRDNFKIIKILKGRKIIDMKHFKYSSDSQTNGEGENTSFIPSNKEQATVKVNSNTGEIEIEKPDYATMYLTFEAIESGTFRFLGATSAHTLSYSLDNGTTWITLAHNTKTPTINAGNTIIWKGNLTPIHYKGIGNFVATGKFDVYGNIMSLLYEDDFVEQISLTDKTFAFYNLFFDNSKVVSAQNLILPATTLVSHCYESMFYGCTSLTTAPELPATTLAEYCYSMMFDGCTSLTTAPELPATTLVTYCYGGMFNGCTNLNYIKMLAIGITARYSLDNWVNGVSSTGTFVKVAAIPFLTGASGIPSGWAVVEV